MKFGYRNTAFIPATIHLIPCNYPDSWQKLRVNETYFDSSPPLDHKNRIIVIGAVSEAATCHSTATTRKTKLTRKRESLVLLFISNIFSSVANVTFDVNWKCL